MRMRLEPRCRPLTPCYPSFLSPLYQGPETASQARLVVVVVWNFWVAVCCAGVGCCTRSS
jgi:hypothetical protein